MKYKRKFELAIAVFGLFCNLFYSKAEEMKYDIYRYQDNDIYIAKFNLKDFAMKIVKSHSKTLGKDYLSNFNQNSLIAVNGGFFFQDGRPVGTLKINNQLFSLGRNEQSVFGWKEDGSKASIDIIRPDLKLFIANKEVRINRFNNFTRANEVVLFSDEYGDYSLTDGKRIEIVVNDRKEIIVINRAGNSKIEPGYMVISFPENFDLSSYKLGSKVRLEVTYTPNFQLDVNWDEFDYIVTGIPLLIKNNKINYLRLEKLKPSFSNMPHARTAICIANDNSLLIAVTNYEKNKGLTLFELAEFLKRQNCKDSLNLDGGSSSVFLYKNEILNKAKFRDREISNAIIVNKR